ncbi:hypothetical protein TorRG33x02_334070, partial [Trema orientale]
MSNPLDRYTSAYLLSGYSFNDYRLKSAPSLASEDALDDDHGRDSNLGLQDGGNDLGLGLMNDPLHEDAAVLENLGGASRLSGGVKSDPRVEDTNTAAPLHKFATATLGFGPSGASRSGTRSGMATGSAFELGDVRKAGYDIVSTDPIHSLQHKRFHAGHANSGFGSGIMAGPSRHDGHANSGFGAGIMAGPSRHVGPSTIAQSGHGPSFANVVSGCNLQDQIGFNGSASPLQNSNSNDSLIAPELSKPTIKGNYVC